MPSDVLVRCLEERRDESAAEAQELRKKMASVSASNRERLGLLLTMDTALSAAEARAQWREKTLARVHDQSSANLRSA